jgi:hypothetical protein
VGRLAVVPAGEPLAPIAARREAPLVADIGHGAPSETAVALADHVVLVAPPDLEPALAAAVEESLRAAGRGVSLVVARIAADPPGGLARGPGVEGLARGPGVEELARDELARGLGIDDLARDELAHAPGVEGLARALAVPESPLAARLTLACREPRGALAPVAAELAERCLAEVIE